jgi:hypothetical protein
MVHRLATHIAGAQSASVAHEVRLSTLRPCDGPIFSVSTSAIDAL